jgi:hypothetical protein
MQYTHNLKLLLIDENNNIINNEEILNEIKCELVKENKHNLKWNDQYHNFIIKWDKIMLSDVNKQLMGDLFTRPIYDFDSIILDHTQETIKKLNCKYFVKFYISKIICDKRIDKNSVGIV